MVPKPRDKYRIICIGGSTTFEGSTNNSTYPALLENKLNNYFHCDRIEVLNCGISGLNQENICQGGTDYFRDVCHLRSKGIKAKADVIFSYIKDYLKQVR